MHFAKFIFHCSTVKAIKIKHILNSLSFNDNSGPIKTKFINTILL